MKYIYASALYSRSIIATDNSDDISNGDLLSQLADRIDSLNRVPLGKSVILALSLASFFAYYDFSNYAYISPSIRELWNLPDSELAFGGSVTVFGYVVGSFGITAYADRYGRKPALILSIVTLAAGSMLAAVSLNMTQLIVFRLITGIGIGSEIAVVGSYIAEMSPRTKRGRYTSLIIVLGWVGITLSGPIALSFIQGAENGKVLVEPWRLVLGLAAVPALIGLVLRIRMQESLRWLLSRGRIQETNQALAALGLQKINGPAVTSYSSDAVDLQKDKQKRKHKHQQSDYSPKDTRLSREPNIVAGTNPLLMFKRYKISRTLVLITVWFLVLIPIYASLLLVAEYVNQGYDLIDSISINVLASTGFVAGGLWSIAFADKIERRYQIAVASVTMGVAFILRGALIQDYFGLVISSILVFGANAWLITSLIAYTGENFPTRIRSTGTGIVEGAGRLIATTGPLIFVFLQPLGFFYLMVGLSIFPLLASIIMISCGRNTLNASLDILNK